MFDKIVKHIISHFNSQSDTDLPSQVVVSKVLFELKYKEISVGFLEFSNERWSFYYSEEFKLQNELSPIVSFPDKTKKYEGTELWSFFTSRIPDNTESDSYSDWKNKQTFKKSNANLIDQLKSYGRRTITNPFDLLVA